MWKKFVTLLLLGTSSNYALRKCANDETALFVPTSKLNLTDTAKKYIFYITKWGHEITLVTTHIFGRLEVERMSFFGGSFVFFPHFDRLVSFTSNKPWTSDVVGNSIYTSFAIQWACNNKVFKVKSSFHPTVEPESIKKRDRTNFKH